MKNYEQNVFTTVVSDGISTFRCTMGQSNRIRLPDYVVPLELRLTLCISISDWQTCPYFRGRLNWMFYFKSSWS